MQGGLALFLALFVLLQHEFPCASSSLAEFNHSGEEPAVLRCIEREREALLAFKQDIVEDDDSRAVFSSWGTQIQKRECCKWKGVQCSNATGHVIQLDLGYEETVAELGGDVSPYTLQGKMISPKLIELQHLEYLDLSWIDFKGTQQFPPFIASLTNLRHLDLSLASLGGQIPSKLGNLTHLQYLDLGFNNLSGQIPSTLGNLTHLQYLDLMGNLLSVQIPSTLGNLTHLQYLHLGVNHDLHVQNLDWLRPLSSLTYLDLSDTNLSVAFDWPEVVNKLPKLQHLSLSGCGLPSPPIHSDSSSTTKLSNINSSKSLAHVDLSFNNLTFSISSNSIFPWLSFHYNTNTNTSLVFLDLSYNNISGQFSKFVQLHLSTCAQNSLENLYLSSNHLSGSLPNLTNFMSLKVLHLRDNQLRGRVPESIGHVSKLETLDLGSNDLEGVISETHFSRLSNLQVLDLSLNSIVLNLSSDWIPPFQLRYIFLQSCKQLNSHFPKWILTQKHYSYLDISASGISDVIPSGFWDLPSDLEYMNISHNQIRGTIENPNLSSNQLEGPFPTSFLNASHLDLSNNRISGSISSLCPTPGMSFNLKFLRLSNNNFSGEFPDCLMHFKNLIKLDLSNNSFSGKIPSTIGSLFRLETLKLGGNKFVGEFPSSLKNCTSLQVIDVGHNQLSGPIPEWLAVSFPRLIILQLSSNHFTGSMPFELCHLPRIQILDLSVNNISGSIPSCLQNLVALAQKGNSSPTVSHDDITLLWNMPTSTYDDIPLLWNMRTRMYDDITLLWKGRPQEFEKTLGLVKSLDLSSNGFTGKIPSEITHLVGLISLNLSRNQLTGQLPPDIGKLDSLDSLDLSRNQIDGRIPTSLARIDRLGLLDLSYNNLLGKIPTGTQLQGFNSSVYAGNPQLCGPPLTKVCDSEQNVVSNEVKDKDDDELITQGFYISMAVGFALAFWGVSGSLIINRAWRHAYFNLLNAFNDWFYVRFALIKQKLKDRYA